MMNEMSIYPEWPNIFWSFIGLEILIALAVLAYFRYITRKIAEKDLYIHQIKSDIHILLKLVNSERAFLKNGTLNEMDFAYKTADKLVFNEISIGAREDLQQATGCPVHGRGLRYELRKRIVKLI